MTSILVTGGTGNLGGHVLPLLHGTDVRVTSRTPRPAAARGDDRVEYVVADTVAGTGLDDAVRGIDTVLHLAGSNKGDDVGTANLVRAAQDAGIRHFVMISVIGADTVPIGYFRNKDRAEQTLAASGIPFTVLRAAQFHDFAWNMLVGMARMPIVPAPRAIRLEPVDVGEVAARLVELTHGEPQGRVADLAGPEVLDAPTLLRGILAARGAHRPLMPMGIPGAIGRAYRAGDNLARGAVTRGTRTWDDYLSQRSPVGA